MHQKDLQYIEDMMEYCAKKQMKLVMITHHPPTKKVLSSHKKESDFSCLYYTDLDRLLKKELVHTWICGHVHNNFDMITEGGTRLLGNQKGKVRDNITDYKMDCCVNIT
jgi:Icc-related predicted phosphoesterase